MIYPTPLIAKNRSWPPTTPLSNNLIITDKGEISKNFCIVFSLEPHPAKGGVVPFSLPGFASTYRRGFAAVSAFFPEGG